MSELKPKLRFGEFNNAWSFKKLSELSELITKGTTPKKFAQTGVNFIKIESLKGKIFDLSKCLKINESVHCNELSRSILKEDDILFAIAGSVGKLGLVTKNLLPANTNQALAIIRLKDTAEKHFLLEILDSKRMKKYIYQSLSVGAQPNLNLQQIGNFKFLGTSKTEQKKIASFLTSVDKKIQQLTRKKELLEQYKKGVMQKIFSQEIRFKDDDGGEFPEWEEKKLSSIAEIIGGGTPSTSEMDFWSGDINWFTPTEIRSRFIKESERKITSEGLKNSSAKLLPEGTILFTSRATIAEIGFATRVCTTNQGFQSIVVNNENNSGFVYYLIKKNKKEFIRKSQGSTFLEISSKEMKKMKFSIPSPMEQVKISEYLSNLDSKIEAVDIQIGKSKDFKKGLLQQMFV